MLTIILRILRYAADSVLATRRYLISILLHIESNTAKRTSQQTDGLSLRVMAALYTDKVLPQALPASEAV